MRKLLILLLLCITQASAQVTINWNHTSQTIDGFGAEDWNSAESLTTGQAAAFFSPTSGIGLSILRSQNYGCPNTGGCSAVVGNVSDLTTLTKAVANGAIVDYGINPPASMKCIGQFTKGTLCSNAGGSNPNSCIEVANYSSFASYTVSWLQMLATNGITVNTLMLANEADPARDALTNSLGACYWSAAGFNAYIPIIGAALVTAGLNTRVAFPANGDWFTSTDDTWSTCLNNPTCAQYVDIVANHGYIYSTTGGGGPDGFPAGYCCATPSQAPSNVYPKFRVWQSEINGGWDYNSGAGLWNWDASMKDALVWARNISDYMNTGLSAWEYWELADCCSGPYNDGLMQGNLSTTSKRMFVLGNWSKFVRPGWVHVNATFNPASGIYVTAFKQNNTQSFAIVVLNSSSSSSTQTITFNGVQPNAVVPNVTSATQNLVALSSVTVTSGVVTYTFPPQTVTTLTGTISGSGGGGGGGNQTFYIDYTNGNDSNAGTSTGSPLKHAPGMQGCTGTCNSLTLNPGDSVIFRGCVDWPNAVWPWYPKFAGTKAQPIYNGVDKTWWDATVSGCSRSWNRPILDAGGASFFSHASDPRMVVVSQHAYNTFDNFEFIGYYTDGGGPSNVGITTDFVDFGGGTVPGAVVSNSYFHGWVDAFFSMGTGDVAANSSTITNFVPFSYSPSPATNWPSLVSSGGLAIQAIGCWPIQNGGPLVTSISGSNPYTIVTNSTTVSNACPGVIVQMGIGAGLAIAGGSQGSPCTDCEMLNNVIDGLDTTIVQMNPYPDCGLSEGNNHACLASVTAEWRQPGTWIGNEIRYYCNGVIGQTTAWIGNTIEYWRPCGNPTAHTNIIESTLDVPVNGISLAYNNLIQHASTVNPSVPTGRQTVGVPFLWGPNASNNTLYTFNNVMYDTLQNAVWERGSSTGKWIFFNNTGNCGPAWSLIYVCLNGGQGADTIINNFFVTTNGTPFVPAAGQTLHPSNNTVMTPTAAQQVGLTPNQSFVYQQVLMNSPQVGAGTSTASICSALAAINATAGKACGFSSTYGVIYNTTTHTVQGPTVTNPIARPSTPDTGAYQLGQPGSQPSPPTMVQATAN